MFRISLTCLTPFLLAGVLTGTAQSQTIFAEQDQLKQQVNELRRDVDELKNTVGALRRAVVKQGVASHKVPEEKTSPVSTTAPEPSKPMDDETITKEVCLSVGHFFEQIEKALTMADGDQAEDVMKKAITRLNSVLDRYAQYGRVRHISDLAGGLAWDTYTAVEQRYGTTGNEDFIQAIQSYKAKYKTACKGN